METGYASRLLATTFPFTKGELTLKKVLQKGHYYIFTAMSRFLESLQSQRDRN